jgi:hypothetical protein
MDYLFVFLEIPVGHMLPFIPDGQLQRSDHRPRIMAPEIHTEIFGGQILPLPQAFELRRPGLPNEHLTIGIPQL